MKRDLRTSLLYPAAAGGLYAALTMLLSPISYGAVQLRLAEALCVLPFFLPNTAVGLCLGCALANTLSAAGALDVIFGSLATLFAGLCTAALGKSFRETGLLPGRGTRLLAVLMPVLWNGLVVGAVLSWSFTRERFFAGLLLMGGQVALGEAAVMLLIGLPFMKLLPRLLPKAP